jgi:hypothetical protein
MILSPSNCSEEMSPYERVGDIEQERAKEVDGIKSSGDGQDSWQVSSLDIRSLPAPCEKTFSGVQKGGCPSISTWQSRDKASTRPGGESTGAGIKAGTIYLSGL